MALDDETRCWLNTIVASICPGSAAACGSIRINLCPQPSLCFAPELMAFHTTTTTKFFRSSLLQQNNFCELPKCNYKRLASLCCQLIILNQLTFYSNSSRKDYFFLQITNFFLIGSRVTLRNTELLL